jgi:ribose 5-phosphate isomerase A
MEDKTKIAAAQKALSFVKPEMVVGLGSGSTAEVFIGLLGRKNSEEELNLTCIATSSASEELAKKAGLVLTDFSNADEINAAFDGADQVDQKFNLIKGLGGALVREKIVDYRARKFYVLVGENKMVKELSGIVPVEVIPLAEEPVRRELIGLGARTVANSMDGAKKFISDNGNIILHPDFQKISDPVALDGSIVKLPGVLESGIFTSRNVAVLVGRKDGTSKVLG